MIDELIRPDHLASSALNDVGLARPGHAWQGLGQAWPGQARPGLVWPGHAQVNIVILEVMLICTSPKLMLIAWLFQFVVQVTYSCIYYM